MGSAGLDRVPISRRIFGPCLLSIALAVVGCSPASHHPSGEARADRASLSAAQLDALTASGQVDEVGQVDPLAVRDDFEPRIPGNLLAPDALPANLPRAPDPVRQPLPPPSPGQSNLIRQVR